MFAILRVLVVYVISYLAAKGLIPESLADMVLNNPEAMIAIELGIATIVTVAVGWVSQKAGLPIVPPAVPQHPDRVKPDSIEDVVQNAISGADDSEIAQDLRDLATTKATAELARAMSRRRNSALPGKPVGPVE